LPSIVERLESD